MQKYKNSKFSTAGCALLGPCFALNGSAKYANMQKCKNAKIKICKYANM